MRFADHCNMFIYILHNNLTYFEGGIKHTVFQKNRYKACKSPNKITLEFLDITVFNI